MVKITWPDISFPPINLWSVWNRVTKRKLNMWYKIYWWDKTFTIKFFKTEQEFQDYINCDAYVEHKIMEKHNG